MTNSTITTKISAAFLATVLVAGIIALSSPSFMVGAQAIPEYRMEDRYSNNEESDYGMDSYGEEESYGNDRDHGMDSYGEEESYGNDRDYGMDSYGEKSYGSEPEYGSDSYGEKAYGNNDYKTQYSSYGKDDREKSKDSVSIKKVKCNNINLNLNGLNITAGGSANGGANGDDNGADDSSQSISANGYGNDDRKKKVVDKKDGFTFVCINNNNNNVTGGNVSAPTPTPTPTPVENECEECFDNLTVDLRVILAEALREGFEIGPLDIAAGSTIADICEELDRVGPIVITAGDLIGFIFEEGIFQEDDIFSLIGLLLCLQALNLVDIDLFAFIDLLEQRGLVAPGATVPATPTTP
jgi:hypothetical protein